MANNRSCLQYLFAFSFLLNISCVSAQTAPPEKHVDTVNSSVLNQKRIAWIYSPNKSNTRLPVVYVLDGEVNFDLVVNTIKRLKSEMIIVGVAFINPGTVDVNAERTRDYTPTHVTACPYLDSSSIASSGGGRNFMKFLQSELMPYIDSKYPTSASRMLIGHSFGGLTAINALYNYTDLFDSYLAIDPSMWWDDRKLLNEIKSQKKNTAGKKIFVALANSNQESLKQPGMEFCNWLSQNKKESKWKYYPDNDHLNVVNPAVYDGLNFLLNNK